MIRELKEQIVGFQVVAVLDRVEVLYALCRDGTVWRRTVTPSGSWERVDSFTETEKT